MASNFYKISYANVLENPICLIGTNKLFEMVIFDELFLRYYFRWLIK